MKWILEITEANQIHFHEEIKNRLSSKKIEYWGKYLGVRGTSWRGNGEDYITRSFKIIYTPQQIIFGLSNQEEWDGWDMWHVRGRGEVYTEFRWVNRVERDHLEDLSVDGRIIFKWSFKKWRWGAWIGLIWLRVGTGGGFLWVR